jgi:hypothetical protein
MKIKFSLSKLEIARINPVQFSKSLKSKNSVRNIFSYSRWMAFQNAIHHWNKTNSESRAINYLTNALSNFKIVQNNPIEIDKYIAKLQAYINALNSRGANVIESKHRVLIDTNPFVSLSSQVPSVNMNINGGYTIIFLSKGLMPLDSELRFPLLQNHYASVVYGVDLFNVEIGYFNFENERIELKSFSKNRIKQAINELNDICKIIYQNY